MSTILVEGLPGNKMRLDKDVAVPLRDGAEVKADVYLPEADGKYPVLMTYGPYGKDCHISQFLGEGWETLKTKYPEVLSHSSGKFMVFERPDPEPWVGHGYAVVHVDCRGAGRAPGKLDVNSPQEFSDFHDAIDWAGGQAWSNGKVGLLGISYYAAGQWMTASYKPKHLAAILPWQGTCDFYRDRTRHGGIFCDGFVHRWWNRSVLNNQHGNGQSSLTDFINGQRTTGTESLTPEQLAANRQDYIENVRAHPLLDPWYAERSADLSQIDVPALVVANWSGLGLHLRGTIQGFLGIASKEKWLKVQAGPYFATFFSTEGRQLQRKFFDHFLKGMDNGWQDEPRIDITVRGVGDGVHRHIHDTGWPLTGTQFLKLYLDASNHGLASAPPAAEAEANYAAQSDGLTFTTPPLDEDMEIAGPLIAKLQLSSSTPDMDMFCTLLAFDPAGKEISFATNFDPSPVSQGWLRITQRKLDPARSTDWQPVHTHDQGQPLQPGEIVEAEVEIWPTGVFLPKGSRLALLVQGKDYEGLGVPGSSTSGFFMHADPVDRPLEKYSGDYTVHTGGGRECYLQIPVIPAT